ncbi:MAG: DUF4838 domain-containing protein [Verrucomicrobia bacterium]|nr:DUF4838 domain-containing protein [Verrucomicrobiota bacterium]
MLKLLRILGVLIVVLVGSVKLASGAVLPGAQVLRESVEVTHVGQTKGIPHESTDIREMARTVMMKEALSAVAKVPEEEPSAPSTKGSTDPVARRVPGTSPQKPLGTSISLSQKGLAPHTIVVPDEAKDYEQTAAEQLALYLNKITGADFPVMKESEAPAAGPVISVGLTKRFEQAFPEINVEKLKPDSIVMKSKGKDFFFVGEGTRGTIYAANTFLEDVCGVRWWTPFEETVPENPDLAVPPPDKIYEPPFLYRDTHSQVFTGTVLATQYQNVTEGLAERRQFAVRLRNNGNVNIPEDWGGSRNLVMSDKCYRTFEQFIGPREFYKTHPEWFQGQASHQTQLCLSNEAMRAEFLQRAKAWVDAAPDQTMFVIMHNDNNSFCQCKDCAAIDEAEGSPAASQVRFMNFLAEELDKHRPGIELVMDAYAYSTKPPSIAKPAPNLIIMLCTTIQSQIVADDAEFMKKWEDWKAVTSRILVWDYTANFANFVNPYPNLHQLGPNIKTFARQGAVGVLEQGNVFNSVADADELKSWVIAHLLWDPSLDENALIPEFVTGYYGAAAGPVMAYLDHIVRSGASTKKQGETAIAFLDLVAMNEATCLLDEAQAKAKGDPALEERIARLRFTLDHQWLLEWRQYRAQADRDGLPFLGPETAQKALEIVRSATARFRSTHDSEHYGWGTMKQHLDTIQQALDPTTEVKPLPPPYDKVAQEDQIQVQEDLLRISSGASIVEDPPASNGSAVMSPATHKDWNIQIWRTFFRTLRRMTGVEGKWKCLIFVRADAKAESGPAMQMGIFSHGNPAVRPERKVALEELAPDAYTPIEVGSLDLGTDALLNTDVWAGPLDNPEDVSAIYVDRVVFIRE